MATVPCVMTRSCSYTWRRSVANHVRTCRPLSSARLGALACRGQHLRRISPIVSGSRSDTDSVKIVWQSSASQGPRAWLSTLSDEELRRKMDTFNELFVTAREEIEYAEESRETTYFDDEAAAAKEAVEEAVKHFEDVLGSVEETKRTEITRSSGLRVEQLKAELDQLLASDDH